MSKTIRIEFDQTGLPRWAQKSPAVVKLAERNLAFRCDLFHADTPYYRRFLTREAERMTEGR